MRFGERRTRSARGWLTAGLCAAVVLGGQVQAASAAERSRGELGATISRTAYGVPHIRAGNIESLAFGFAYAFAEDNLCTIADSYVTVSGERSRYFGPDEEWTFSGNGSVRGQPRLGLLLHADQRVRGDREADSHGPAERPDAGREARGAGLRRGLQPVPARDGCRQPSRPPLSRQGMGAADRGDRRLPALLPARQPRQLWSRDSRDCHRGADGGRRLGFSRAGGAGRRDRQPRGGQLAEPLPARARIQRLRPRGARRPEPAAGCCSATPTSPGTEPSASTRPISRSPGRSTSRAARSTACR